MNKIVSFFFVLLLFTQQSYAFLDKLPSFSDTCLLSAGIGLTGALGIYGAIKGDLISNNSALLAASTLLALGGTIGYGMHKGFFTQQNSKTEINQVPLDLVDNSLQPLKDSTIAADTTLNVYYNLPNNEKWQDLLLTLGIQKNLVKNTSSKAIIQEAARKLITLYHPDKHYGQEQHYKELTAEITEAKNELIKIIDEAEALYAVAIAYLKVIDQFFENNDAKQSQIRLVQFIEDLSYSHILCVIQYAKQALKKFSGTENYLKKSYFMRYLYDTCARRMTITEEQFHNPEILAALDELKWYPAYYKLIHTLRLFNQRESYNLEELKEFHESIKKEYAQEDKLLFLLKENNLECNSSKLCESTKGFSTDFIFLYVDFMCAFIKKIKNEKFFTKDCLAICYEMLCFLHKASEQKLITQAVPLDYIKQIYEPFYIYLVSIYLSSPDKDQLSHIENFMRITLNNSILCLNGSLKQITEYLLKGGLEADYKAHTIGNKIEFSLPALSQKIKSSLKAIVAKIKGIPVDPEYNRLKEILDLLNEEYKAYQLSSRVREIIGNLKYINN